LLFFLFPFSCERLFADFAFASKWIVGSWVRSPSKFAACDCGKVKPECKPRYSSSFFFFLYGPPQAKPVVTVGPHSGPPTTGSFRFKMLEVVRSIRKASQAMTNGNCHLLISDYQTLRTKTGKGTLSGLPDFPWSKHTKLGKILQMTAKYTKWP
jgi:hypothetical protein